MTNETKVINSTNVEIQHSVHSTGDALRKNCVGIALEIIKSMAAAGASSGVIKNMIEEVDKHADIIQKAIEKK